MGHRHIPADSDRVIGYSKITDISGITDTTENTDGLRGGLVVLLPARNAEPYLQEWFASVERFADAVVALDDGSTDATAELLDACPLVKVLLRNPRRDSYEGWDDGANRNRLLEAAAQLGPRWILSLDADERITADDASALRSFITGDALPGLAYGLQNYRMWDGRCDPDYVWTYRLFSFQPGQHFPGEQLHFDPVPTSIGPERHLRTSLRIQHWGSSDEHKRARRVYKYREADPDGRYPTNHAKLDEAPPSTVAWTTRDDSQQVILGPRRTNDKRHPKRLVVLLPARNAQEDLPGWFESVERFADVVVALDDGSTDDTAELLDAHPLVEVLLRNPRRETYEGWDDSANRNALLEAAAELEPDWIFSLDADERIPPGDAEALREFVDNDALAGLAYGMERFLMTGETTYDAGRSLWIYRLFAFEPGQQFPSQRLHFIPIPTSIPSGCHLKTTIRVQHVAGTTADKRQERFEKYLEADPDHEFQDSYDNLLKEPKEVTEFPARPRGMPVLATPAASEAPAVEDFDPDAPALSAIIISRDDEDRIEQCVRSVVTQRCDEDFEVIVVTSGTDRTAQIVREKFPDVRVVELDHPALPGEARNAGLRVARGDYISFPGSHVVLPPGSLQARIEAHDKGWPMVTGTTHNGTFTRSGWAGYFLDNSPALPGRPSGPLAAPPAHCSYEARSVYEVGGFPDDVRAGEDTRVNHMLFRAGHRAWRESEISLTHRNRSTTVSHLVTHHFERGRAHVQFMKAMAADPNDTTRIREFLWAYPTRHLARIDSNVQRWGGPLRSRYRKVRPLVKLGVLSSWLGAHLELRRPSSPDPGPETTPGTGPLTKPLRLVRASPAPRAHTRAVLVTLPDTACEVLHQIMEREYDETADQAALILVGDPASTIHAHLDGPITYLTVLRDPLERLATLYRALRPTSVADMAAFESVVRDTADVQTRLLGSTAKNADAAPDAASLARAMTSLDRDDMVIGLHDRFDETVVAMVRTLGWGYPAYRTVKTDRKPDMSADLPDAVIELIMEHNQLDTQLYEHARTRFEERLASMDGLESELELVRLTSRYRPSP